MCDTGWWECRAGAWECYKGSTWLLRAFWISLDRESQSPRHMAALAWLTDVQGHALLGVRLQLVVMDGHLPLQEQQSIRVAVDFRPTRPQTIVCNLP